MTQHGRAEEETGNLSTKHQSLSTLVLFPQVTSEGNSDRVRGSEDASKGNSDGVGGSEEVGTVETRFTRNC